VLFDIAMAGRGRGRGRKKSPKSNGINMTRVGVPAAAEDSNITNNNHVGRKLMLTTSIDTLLRIEATIILTTRGKGSISIDNFYEMATSHEWLGLSNSKDTVDNVKIHTQQQQLSKSIAKKSIEVYELVSQLSETERLLFDFMVMSTCDLRDVSTHIYPLYQLNGSRLEIKQQPTPKEGVLLPARSEVLGTMCHLSHNSFDNVAANSNAIQRWWANSKNIAQVILDHRKQAETIKKDKSKAANGVKSSIVSNSTKSTTSSTAHTATTNGDKKMTLEERIRARSLLNPSNAKSKSSKVKESSNQSENKTILELANALRSYSQRRGLASSSGSSALDRLKSRSGDSSNTSASKKNIARLTVMDLMRDARVTWTSVVNESADKHDSSGGNKARPRGGGGKAIVSIDLSRVLFQIRLKMKPNKDVSDKRQMEMQLLELLEKLSELVPAWIQLRKAPTLSGSLSSKKRKTSSGAIETSVTTTATATIKQQKTNIKQCIIVIRNDAVDYNTDVRLKLGGRSHITSAKNESNSTAFAKRSLEEMKGKKQSSLADAIVPPSFLQTYGKALIEPKKKKGKK